MSRLDDLLRGQKLWNIQATALTQVQRLMLLRDEIAAEYTAHFDDIRAPLVETGVLLGALNLINGLLMEGPSLEAKEDENPSKTF